MMLTSVFGTTRSVRACAPLAAVFFIFIGGSVLAKTPDGMPPSEETVCSALKGAAFGLCNAYCEAQDCDVHARPSCPVLRRNFKKITGSDVFPCDARCGDRVIQPGEDCDPPGGECADGRICNPDCTCPEPFCGDKIVDPGEECDPPGSECTRGVTCGGDCTCAEPVGCCECLGTAAPVCEDDVPVSECFARPGCTIAAPGTACDPTLGRCLPGVGFCCDCPAGATCFDAATPGECVQSGCQPVSQATCNPDAGGCQQEIP